MREALYALSPAAGPGFARYMYFCTLMPRRGVVEASASRMFASWRGLWRQLISKLELIVIVPAYQ